MLKEFITTKVLPIGVFNPTFNYAFITFVKKHISGSANPLASVLVMVVVQGHLCKVHQYYLHVCSSLFYLITLSKDGTCLWLLRLLRLLRFKQIRVIVWCFKFHYCKFLLVNNCFLAIYFTINDEYIHISQWVMNTSCLTK